MGSRTPTTPSERCGRTFLLARHSETPHCRRHGRRCRTLCTDDKPSLQRGPPRHANQTGSRVRRWQSFACAHTDTHARPIGLASEGNRLIPAGWLCGRTEWVGLVCSSDGWARGEGPGERGCRTPGGADKLRGTQPTEAGRARDSPDIAAQRNRPDDP